MTRRVIIAGSSGHSSVVLDALLAGGAWKAVGLLDSFLEEGNVRHGHKILGNLEDAAAIAAREDCRSFFVAVGDNWRRRELTWRLTASVEAAEFINVLHPNATVARSAQLGAGVAILAGAIVGPGSVIGDGVLLNTGASADHDCQLRPFASLGPRACLGGTVSVGEGTAICIGATVKHRITIGSWSVVGAGATVLHDLPDSIVAFGTPARVMSSREPADQYL